MEGLGMSCPKNAQSHARIDAKVSQACLLVFLSLPNCHKNASGFKNITQENRKTIDFGLAPGSNFKVHGHLCQLRIML